MPGSPIVSFLFCAAAGADAPATAAATRAAPASKVNVLRSIGNPPVRFLSLLLQFEFGRARLAHQRAPDPLAQLGKARKPQCVARAWIRQIDFDRLMDARWTTFQHDDAMAEQNRFFDRMRDEDHRGRPLFPDTQQLELQNLARLRVD